VIFDDMLFCRKCATNKALFYRLLYSTPVLRS